MRSTFAGTPVGTDPGLAEIIAIVAEVSADLARRIRRGGIDENLAHAQGTNTDGDTQKALDVIADEAFMAALSGTALRYYASEEQDSVVEMNPAGTLGMAIDPLDGSSNIDSNVSIGTIFGIYPAHPDGANATFFQAGRSMVASGYAIYGPQTCLMVTYGAGVLKYVLDPDSNEWVFTGMHAPIPEESIEFAINASNYRHWPAPIRAYVDDMIAGSEGPRGRNFNMRWVASLVAETHRILTRGGIFLYPRDERKGYGSGRLRLTYECAPIAFLIEQAGGRATDGQDAILDRQADSLHARCPFIFGSASKVARVATYHDLPEQETQALFNQRGLFRI